MKMETNAVLLKGILAIGKPNHILQRLYHQLSVKNIGMQLKLVKQVI